VERGISARLIEQIDARADHIVVDNSADTVPAQARGKSQLLVDLPDILKILAIEHVDVVGILDEADGNVALLGAVRIQFKSQRRIVGLNAVVAEIEPGSDVMGTEAVEIELAGQIGLQGVVELATGGIRGGSLVNQVANRIGFELDRAVSAGIGHLVVNLGADYST
jgi:hypothetical protein